MRAKPDWDREALDVLVFDEKGLVQLTRDETRDHLILQWLKRGDPQPLIHFLKTGHAFGPKLRAYLAEMLDEGSTEFRLVVEKRNKQRRTRAYPQTASIEWRNTQAAARVLKLMDSGLPYEKAIEKVAADTRIDKRTIGKTYDRAKRESRGR
jgi:hypothetical protein